MINEIVFTLHFIGAVEESPSTLLKRAQTQDAEGKEYLALKGYEQIIEKFPDSKEALVALKGEFSIACLYIKGLKLPLFGESGPRLVSGLEEAEEILIRNSKRDPSAEGMANAMFELGSLYYHEKNFKESKVTFTVMLEAFPRDPRRPAIVEMLIESLDKIYGGPGRDSTPLEEKKVLLQTDKAKDAMTSAQIQELDEKLAQEMFDTSEFYRKRGDIASQKFYLKRLVQKYPQTKIALKLQAK